MKYFRNYNDKKAISSVVATALLILVTVGALTAFQGWYASYQSQLQVFSEQKEQSNSKILSIENNKVYLKSSNNENVTINKVTIENSVCSTYSRGNSGNLTTLDISSCNICGGRNEVFIETQNDIYSYNFYSGNDNQPSFTFGINDSSPDKGDSIELNWSASNYDSCTASGDWSGSKSLNGTQTFTNLSVGTYDYSLSCNYCSKAVTKSISFEIVTPPGQNIWREDIGSGVNTLDLSGNHLYSGSSDGSFRKFDLDGNQNYSIVPISSSYDVFDLDASTSGIISLALVDGANKDLRIYNSSSGNELFDATNNDRIFSVAVTSQGDTFYTEDTNLKRINNSGGIIWTESSVGSIVRDIDLDSNEYIYTTGVNTDEVYKFNPSGGVNWTYSLPTNSLELAITPDDKNIYVGLNDGDIIILNSDGSLNNTLSYGNKIRALAIDNQSNYYIGPSDTFLYKYNSSNDLVWSYNASARVEAIAIGENVVYAAAGQEIHKISN